METSTGTGLRFIHPVEQTHERVASQACPLHVVQNEYLPTTREQHGHKYEVHKDTDMAMLSVRQDFVRNLDEKLRMSDWFLPRTGVTEHSTQFIQKEMQPMVERVLAPGPLSICTSRGLGRNEQPAVPPGANSFAKYLDPYVSTTQLNHTQFPDAQLRGIARNDAVTFWTYVTPNQRLHREPVYDQLVFHTRASNRMIPRPICPIPHRSVQKVAFIHPYHREFSNKTWNCGVEVPVTVLPASPWETLSVPYMYCTEHCHIGTGRPVRQVVEPGSIHSKHSQFRDNA